MPPRRFKIRDILVLTAALGQAWPGLAWMRCYEAAILYNGMEPITHRPTGPHLYFQLREIDRWIVDAPYIVAPVGIALAGLITWGTPRPRRWRMATRRPGVAAGVAVLLIITGDLFTTTYEIIRGLTSGDEYRTVRRPSRWPLSGEHAAVAVASAWVLLAMSGRWRREPGWLDALGIALGVSWLLLFAWSWGIHNLPPWSVRYQVRP